MIGYCFPTIHFCGSGRITGSPLASGESLQKCMWQRSRAVTAPRAPLTCVQITVDKHGNGNVSVHAPKYAHQVHVRAYKAQMYECARLCIHANAARARPLTWQQVSRALATLLFSDCFSHPGRQKEGCRGQEDILIRTWTTSRSRGITKRIPLPWRSLPRILSYHVSQRKGMACDAGDIRKTQCRARHSYTCWG
jgi:hypothetical protein